LSTDFSSLEAPSSVTGGLRGATWLSISSSELDDGGEGDKDVALLAEDGVGESLPYEVDARGEFGPPRRGKRR